MAYSGFPNIRLRRLRQNKTLRNMIGLPLPGPEKFMWPVFVVDGADKKIPIAAMPGQFRYSIDRLIKDLESVVNSGIGGIMLFGVPDDKFKKPDASYAYDDKGLVQRAIKAIRKYYPDLLVFTDVCVCAYTTHGHCGVLRDDGNVDNDPSIELLSKMALSHALHGAHGVSPSAMMDGQVSAIREVLDGAKLNDTILMSYSTKFASSMYGPFREAAASSPGTGDRQKYQAPYNDPRQALRESQLDEQEGADILMIKPALFYLDVIAKIRENSNLPIAAYNVSGEYSMLIASAQQGWGDLHGMVREACTALCRAGTDILISYWANQYNEIFKP
jgi:porphobilinogen synthase